MNSMLRKIAIAMFLCQAAALCANAQQFNTDQMNFPAGPAGCFYQPGSDTCALPTAVGAPNWTIQTGSYTAVCGQPFRMDNTSAATITLPAVSTGCLIPIMRGVSAATFDIAPPGGATYDGPSQVGAPTNQQLPQGATMLVWTDGTNYHATTTLVAGTHCTITPALTGNIFDCTGGSGTVNSGTANQLAYYSSTGTAVSGTNALPSGTTATTQSPGDNSTKVATDAFVLANGGSGGVQYNSSSTNYFFQADSHYMVADNCTNGGLWGLTSSTFGISSGTLTVNYTSPGGGGTPIVGTILLGEHFPTSTYLNGVAFTVASATSSSFTASTSLPNTSGTVTEVGNFECAANIPMKVSQKPFFKGHGTVYNFAQSGAAFATTQSNYTTYVHPLIHSGDWVFATPGVEDFVGAVGGGHCGASTIEGQLQTYWAGVHTDGGKVVGVVPGGTPPAGTIYCSAATADYIAVRNWIRAQGRTPANASSGQYWDRLVTTDSVLFNSADSLFVQQSGDSNPGHPKAGGAELEAELYEMTLAGLTSMIGTDLDQVAIPFTPGAVQFGVDARTSRAANQGDISPLGYVIDTGTSGAAYVATLSPAITSYVAGLTVTINPASINSSTTPTLNVNGLGTKTITKNGSSALSLSTDIIPGILATFKYDGTRFQLQNPQSAATASCGGTIPCTNTSNTFNGGVQTNVTATPLSIAGIDQGSFSAAGTPTGIQHTQGLSAGGGVTTITLGSSVTAGDQLIAGCAGTGGVSDTLSNSWTSIGSVSDVNIYITQSATGGSDSITCAFPSGIAFASEWSGLQTATDVSAATATITNSTNTVSVTTTQTDMLLAIAMNDNKDGWIVNDVGGFTDSIAPTSYTLLQSQGGNSGGRTLLKVWTNTLGAGTNSFSYTTGSWSSGTGTAYLLLIPIKLSGVSQSADLRQFQKSDGTVLSAVDKAGKFRGAHGSSETVSFSSTPTFSTAYRSSTITLTGNITSFTLAAGIDGQEKTLCFVQDGTGSRTVAAPTNVHGFFTVGSTASKYNCQHFTYFLTPAIWVADSAGATNQ